MHSLSGVDAAWNLPNVNSPTASPKQMAKKKAYHENPRTLYPSFSEFELPQHRFKRANPSVGVSSRVEDFAAIYFLRALQEF